MSDPAILEAAARALRESVGMSQYGRAEVVLAAVTPLIEAAALDRAALLAEATKALEAMQAAYYDFHDRNSMTEPITGRAANANALATDVLLKLRTSHAAPLIRATALEEASEWKTMENAPKDGTHFLWCEELRGRCAVIYWPTYKECFTTGYWHPLPPPPAESSAA